MAGYPDVEKLLAAHPDESPVLSLYLEIPPEQQDQRELPARAGTLIAEADGLLAGPAARQVVARSRQAVRDILVARTHDWAGHCAAIFIWPSASLAETLILPAGTGERAVLAARPHVRPLLTALRRRPPYWIIVVDRRHAWLFAVSGDQVRLVARPTSPGVASPGYGGWYGLESYNVNERIAELAHQHFGQTAELLERAIRGGPGAVYAVGGHAETIPRFLATLGQDTRGRLAGSFVVDTATMTPARIRALADPVITTWAEKAAADLIVAIGQRRPGGLAAVGMAECLAAVRQHGIRTLAAPVQALVPGLACRVCGALGRTRAELSLPGSGCAHGDSAVIEVPDLVEEIAVAAIADGGDVEPVADPPGGIAAVLRFPLPAPG